MAESKETARSVVGDSGAPAPLGIVPPSAAPSLPGGSPQSPNSRAGLPPSPPGVHLSPGGPPRPPMGQLGPSAPAPFATGGRGGAPEDDAEASPRTSGASAGGAENAPAAAGDAPAAAGDAPLGLAGVLAPAAEAPAAGNDQSASAKRQRTDDGAPPGAT